MRMARLVYSLLCILPETASYVGVPVIPMSFGRRVHSHTALDVTARPSSTEDAVPPQRKKRVWTAAEVQAEMIKNPAKYQRAADAATAQKKPVSRRTRQRVEAPQQQYRYASQRKQQPTNETVSEITTATATTAATISPDWASLKEWGWTTAAAFGAHQATDPVADQHPVLVGHIQVGDSDQSSTDSYAYIIDKPAGWAILGSTSSSSTTTPSVVASTVTVEPTEATNTVLESSLDEASVDDTDTDRPYVKRVQGRDEDGSAVVVEYSEWDVLALMTRDEIEDYLIDIEDNAAETRRVRRYLRQLDRGMGPSSSSSSIDDTDSQSESQAEPIPHDSSIETLSPQTAANLKRIAARQMSTDNATDSMTARFAVSSRPSVVAWLKELKARMGTPIRGGKYWTAVAGAVDIDDSGLVLMCPRANVDQCAVEYASYTAVVGTGGWVDAALDKKDKSRSASSLQLEPPQIQVVSRLRKGRGDDLMETVTVKLAGGASTTTHVVQACQDEFANGIRGDVAASPLDRRAPRRLIHCHALSASSLVHDDTVAAETKGVPDDIAVLADRRNHLQYHSGSFLGRSALRDSALTTAYREINGAADGFPGWTVDRYGEWLAILHDPKQPRGPLPSIHDGKTAGVYYLESNPDRSIMGVESEVRPRLWEGRPAPDVFPVLENGVTYLVSVSRDLSTGIFLDQRPQRAWLTRHCGPDTRILNCFAHTGAFSVAAATAGASTVSLDLSKKWLDRLPEQLAANGIAFDERHDCVYGDCFDWLTRLAKRGETYDIVILDPPSTSVGQKRKRWSVKDMNELVALASGLVKKGGLLWTSTNSASMPVAKFVSLCRQGLVEAGIPNAKLERIQPMPVDFPSIGAQPVKNLMWRIP